MPHPPVVFIVEDDPDVARWLAHSVTAQGYRSEMYRSGGAFLAAADRSQSGCVVLDVQLPDMSGLEVQERLVSEHCTLPLIVVTGAANIPLCVSAMQRGAFYFLEKPLDPQEFARIVRQAIESGASTRQRAEEKSRVRALLAGLSDEDRALIGLIAQGLINKEIAGRLDVSVRTVQTRLNRIMKAVGVASRFGLARLGAELPPVEPPPAM